jgi:hypothetical protein
MQAITFHVRETDARSFCQELSCRKESFNAFGLSGIRSSFALVGRSNEDDRRRVKRVAPKRKNFLTGVQRNVLMVEGWRWNEFLR